MLHSAHDGAWLIRYSGKARSLFFFLLIQNFNDYTKYINILIESKLIWENCQCNGNSSLLYAIINIETKHHEYWLISISLLTKLSQNIAYIQNMNGFSSFCNKYIIFWMNNLLCLPILKYRLESYDIDINCRSEMNKHDMHDLQSIQTLMIVTIVSITVVYFVIITIIKYLLTT